MRKLLLAAIFSSVTICTANAQSGAQSGAQPTVEWLLPTAKSNPPQTAEQAEAGRQGGRALPTPEELQPTLDSSLEPYAKRTDLTLSGSISGASSDVLVDLARRWIGAFQKIYPDVKITIAPPYAGSLGAEELATGALDFVVVSRELRPVDLTKFKAKFGYEPISVPITGGTWRHFGFLDSVGFFVNPANPLAQLSYGQLDAILSKTHLRGGEPITRWGQLGLTGEWADAPINVYAIQPWNGFEEFVRQRVLSTAGKRGEWRDGLNFSKLVFPVAKSVAGDKFGLGYSGLAYLDAPVRVLPLAETDAGPFYAPSYDNVAMARYGLSRLTYFNANMKPGAALDPIVGEFLRFIRSREGQQIALSQAIFLPLRAEQVTQSQQLFK